MKYKIVGCVDSSPFASTVEGNKADMWRKLCEDVTTLMKKYSVCEVLVIKCEDKDQVVRELKFENWPHPIPEPNPDEEYLTLEEFAAIKD